MLRFHTVIMQKQKCDNYTLLKTHLFHNAYSRLQSDYGNAGGQLQSLQNSACQITFATLSPPLSSWPSCLSHIPVTCLFYTVSSLGEETVTEYMFVHRHNGTLTMLWSYSIADRWIGVAKTTVFICKCFWILVTLFWTDNSKIHHFRHILMYYI